MYNRYFQVAFKCYRNFTKLILLITLFLEIFKFCIACSYFLNWTKMAFMGFHVSQACHFSCFDVLEQWLLRLQVRGSHAVARKKSFVHLYQEYAARKISTDEFLWSMAVNTEDDVGKTRYGKLMLESINKKKIVILLN